MRKHVVANWKMNGSQNLVECVIRRLLGETNDSRITLCIPAPYLYLARQLVQHSYIECGAQDVSEYGYGAYTGEISAAMIADLGCKTVIVGHSERRQLFGESAAVISAKLNRGLDVGLEVVFCVGESLEVRDAGAEKEYVSEQLSTLCELDESLLGRVSVAYEPVWAIGTGRTASEAQIAEMHTHIKKVVDIPVLYGGSVKSVNVASIMAVPGVDGVLVGGASLDPEEFCNLCRNSAG